MLFQKVSFDVTVAMIMSRIYYPLLSACFNILLNCLLCICIPEGIPTEDKNWPSFFPIIHNDIANEIPIDAQRLQYLAFASWLGM